MNPLSCTNNALHFPTNLNDNNNQKLWCLQTIQPLYYTNSSPLIIQHMPPTQVIQYYQTTSPQITYPTTQQPFMASQPPRFALPQPLPVPQTQLLGTRRTAVARAQPPHPQLHTIADNAISTSTNAFDTAPSSSRIRNTNQSSIGNDTNHNNNNNRTLNKAVSVVFPCSICGREFKHKSNLKTHGRIHDSDAPQCKYCGKKFARTSNLKQHERVHTNERPFKCRYCPKQFKQSHSLTDHLRTHTGERPFKCNLCGKAFTVKHNMSVHRRIHTGEKPYGCSVCHKQYSSKSGLNSHIKKHHSFLMDEKK